MTRTDYGYAYQGSIIAKLSRHSYFACDGHASSSLVVRIA
jgi:hypothetical protein